MFYNNIIDTYKKIQIETNVDIMTDALVLLVPNMMHDWIHMKAI